MKATLKFDLPDEALEFDWAVNAGKMYYMLWDLDQWLRANTKYAPDDMSDDTYKAFEQCREKLREMMAESGIGFN
jgi:hypothetical protein